MEAKNLLSLLLIASFFGAAVFGIFAMHTQGEHGSFCLAALSKGSSCLAGKDAFASLIFHVTAFKSFSTAIFIGSIFAFLLLSSALLTLTLVQGFTVNFAPSFQSRPLSEKPAFSSQRKFAHWLALLENSPNFS